MEEKYFQEFKFPSTALQTEETAEKQLWNWQERLDCHNLATAKTN